MHLRHWLQTITGTALIAGVVLASNAVRTSVPTANARAGHPDTVAAKGFQLVKLAEGSDALENPSGVITHFGLLNDFPPQPIEPTHTEPDENTYLVFDRNPGGPTPGYDYGTHFLYPCTFQTARPRFSDCLAILCSPSRRAGSSPSSTAKTLSIRSCEPTKVIGVTAPAGRFFYTSARRCENGQASGASRRFLKR